MTFLKNRTARVAWSLASLAALAAALGAGKKWNKRLARGGGADPLDKEGPTWCANAPLAGLTHLAGW